MIVKTLRLTVAQKHPHMHIAAVCALCGTQSARARAHTHTHTHTMGRGDILYIEGGLSGTWHERSLVTEWEKLANAHKQ